MKVYFIRMYSKYKGRNNLYPTIRLPLPHLFFIVLERRKEKHKSLYSVMLLNLSLNI